MDAAVNRKRHYVLLITFGVSRRRRKMYCGHATLLRRPGLRASSDGVLATKSERKMLASNMLVLALCLVIFIVTISIIDFTCTR